MTRPALPKTFALPPWIMVDFSELTGIKGVVDIVTLGTRTVLEDVPELLAEEIVRAANDWAATECARALRDAEKRKKPTAP